LGYSDSVELEGETVGNEGLVCPPMGDHGYEVDVSVENEEDYVSVSMRLEKSRMVCLRGRCKLERPVESGAKRPEVEPGLEDERTASRILPSNFFATISAALPLGARINGTCPESYMSENEC
jgi:hypothetical protein